MALAYKEYQLKLEILNSDIILNDDFEFGAFVSGKDGNGIVGLFFVEQTNNYIKYKLTYTNGSEDYLTIPTNGIPSDYVRMTVLSHFDFPLIGTEGVLYIAVDEGKTYIWLDDQMTYIVTGSDIDKIKIIDGGNANEL